jgi:hypothetical protein
LNLVNRKRHEGGGRWPTQQQELLLRAALREGEEAINSWNAWYSSVVDIDRLDDEDSQRLLPLVYSNLRVQAGVVPSLGRLKGTYRYTWYKNHLLLQVAGERLRALHEARIETLVLKGLALISHYYEGVGSRLMYDFDILVRPEQALAAIRVLREAGLREQSWQSEGKLGVERFVPVWYEANFLDAHGGECDLHWHLMPECCQPGADDDFWKAAVPVTIGGVSTQALCPADQLLHVLVHGTRWHLVDSYRSGSTPIVRCVADAITIVNVAAASGDEIDWDRLTMQARKLRLALPLQEVLGYLRESWDLAVPPAVLRSLRTMPVGYTERIEHAARTHPFTLLLWRSLHFWAVHARLMGDAGIGCKLIRFPAYMRQIWGLEHAWQVPFRVMLALGRSLKRLMHGKT